MCVCSVRYPACNAHALYRHLWPAPLYYIYPHYLMNGTIFERQFLIIKCVLIFDTQFCEVFLNVIRTERDMIKNVYWS